MDQVSIPTCLLVQSSTNFSELRIPCAYVLEAPASRSSKRKEVDGTVQYTHFRHRVRYLPGPLPQENVFLKGVLKRKIKDEHEASTNRQIKAARLALRTHVKNHEARYM